MNQVFVNCVSHVRLCSSTSVVESIISKIASSVYRDAHLLDKSVVCLSYVC